MNKTVKTQSAADDGTVVIMANRGPHDFVWEAGHWVATAATGGLVSMIEPLARQPNVAWFCCVSEPSESAREGLFTTAKDQTDSDLNVVPVPLPAGIYREYYGEISNEILWMLQHHLAGSFGFAALDEKRHRAWDSYVEANRRMAEAVVAMEIPIRAFLVQDYHLYLLPEMLRQRFPKTPSLHFVHIPFPEPSVLRLLPKAWREAILRGLLGADIVGFQTASDVHGFLACCEELLGASVDHERRAVILRTGRTVRVRAFPASTDPSAIRALQASPETAEARQRLIAELRELTIIRVDRIEPSKNQILGFTAFGRLLELHPELCGRVRFLAFLIPSRTDLAVHREYHDAVYAEIESVNARFREACGFDPIAVFYTNDRAQALAAMELCDVFLVNSRQDAMNLMVKEWAVVSTRGVLVISETAGVAPEVAGSSLQISALDLEGTVAALAEALAMPLEKRAGWVAKIREGVDKWTARDWLLAQAKELGLSLPDEALPRLLKARSPVVSGVVECELAVLNSEGIHARPAAAFVRCAREFECDIDIVKEGATFPAKSILSVLTANLNRGTIFTLRAEGSDADQAVESIRALLAKFEAENL